MWDGGYGRPMGLHGGYEVGMGLGTDDHTLAQTHHSWVWVRNLFSQSKMVNIVIILNIIDTHTTTQDNPYPFLRVWVCMGMGMGRGENTHGLPMSHTKSTQPPPVEKKKAAPTKPKGGHPTSNSKATGSSRHQSFNLVTYKLHALGWYPRAICLYGTSDNYNTQMVRFFFHI